MKEKNVNRVLDANFNRAKEGLRVCEDVCRFFLSEKKLTAQFKNIRHDLTAAMGPWQLAGLMSARDAAQDVGKGSIVSEFKRRTVADIFYANAQRAKESVRVLEEFSKLGKSRGALRLKAIRYKIYALEQKAVTRF